MPLPSIGAALPGETGNERDSCVKKMMTCQLVVMLVVDRASPQRSDFRHTSVCFLATVHTYLKHPLLMQYMDIMYRIGAYTDTCTRTHYM